MNQSVIAAVLLGLVAGTSALAAEPPQVESYPDANIVFVSFDALQAAHVGCHGYERKVTPTFDAMAARGFRFAQVTSVASWTVPSSMTWFTGVYPSEHKMVNKFAIYQPPVKKTANLKDLAPQLVTLAEIFKRQGYATAGFTGNAGVSGGFGYEQGFDVYYHEKNKFGGFDYSIPKALEWLRENRGRKFFLFLHGYDVHGQHEPAGGFDYRFVDKDYDKRFTGAILEQELLREQGLERGKLSLRDADIRFWRAIYDEKISRADERFRQFLREYEKLGLMDRTIFILTSDHGTEQYEHLRFDHGFTLFQETLHVPLVIQLPKQSAGRVIEQRVSSIDLMPTILELSGAAVPENVRRQMRGASLAPLMKGLRFAPRDVFSETDYRAYTYKRSVIDTQGWKLILTLESKRRELYHLPTDPAESRDLAAKEPATANELEQKIFAHFRSIGSDLAARRWEVGLNPVYASQGKD